MKNLLTNKNHKHICNQHKSWKTLTITDMDKKKTTQRSREREKKNNYANQAATSPQLQTGKTATKTRKNTCKRACAIEIGGRCAISTA